MGANSIYKYPLRHISLQTIKVPYGAQPLSVQLQDNAACLWMLVDANVAPNQTRTIRKYTTAKGEFDLGEKPFQFLGTTQNKEGAVEHWFEELAN